MSPLGASRTGKKPLLKSRCHLAFFTKLTSHFWNWISFAAKARKALSTKGQS